MLKDGLENCPPGSANARNYLHPALVAGSRTEYYFLDPATRSALLHKLG